MTMVILSTKSSAVRIAAHAEAVRCGGSGAAEVPPRPSCAVLYW